MQAKILDQSQEFRWLEFIKSHPLATIHQTPKWGHFQAHIPGRGKYWIIVLEEEGQIIGGTLLIRHGLPKGYCWLYAPRGPLIEAGNMPQLLSEIRKIAKNEKAVFLRVDPPTENPIPFENFRKNRPGFQPEHTLVIDLEQSGHDILAQMKQKGRYNIRLAEKKGIKIHKVNPKDPKNFTGDIDGFYKILKETTKRDNFHGHSEEFYKTMLSVLHPDAGLYLASFKGRIIAGIIVTCFQDTATYYYGASSDNYRNLMAPYLIQWQAMKDAKEDGLKGYDLFGIAPPGTKNHPWKGVTRFKNKFGGKHINYAKAQEYAFKPFHYFFYRLLKILR